MIAYRDWRCHKGCVYEIRCHENDPPLCHGKPMTLMFTTGTKVVPNESIFPFMHPHLGHRPVEVKSWKHYKQLLRSGNKSNELAS